MSDDEKEGEAEVAVEAGDEEDPLAVLALDLEMSGSSVASVFGDFAAHNAVWDYAESFLYLEYLNSWDQSYTKALRSCK